jgi:hypothetical protein
MEPRNRFQGINSASLWSPAGRYDNPIPTRLIAPIDCLKIPALESAEVLCFLLGTFCSLLWNHIFPLHAGWPEFCHFHRPQATHLCPVACIQLGCAVFAAFFIRFEANLSEYGSYSLHMRMFRYIRNYTIYSLHIRFKNIRTNANTNIRFVAKQIHFLILANICFKIVVLKRIFANI